MKKLLLLCAFAASSLSLISIAESDSKPGVEASIKKAPAPSIKPTKASKLLEMEVHNAAERLGEIRDVMVNLRSGRVVYAVMGTGGLLGLGDKLIALPPTALSLTPDRQRLLLEADKESLRAAPGFQSNNWPEMADTSWLSERDRHYAKHVEAQIEEASGAEPGDLTNDSARATASRFETPRTMKMTELIGTKVQDDHNRSIGTIKDASVDLQSGEIRYLVVALPEKDKFMAIAPHVLRHEKGAQHLVLSHSAARFDTAAQFSADQWPTDPKNIIGTVEEPAGSPIDPRSDGRTALDQSNAKRDLMITQQLRRSIMKDPRMSTLTRNITIITADGIITVRGTVADQTEANRIVAFAREIAGNEVINELKVRNAERKTNETTEPEKE